MDKIEKTFFLHFRFSYWFQNEIIFQILANYKRTKI